MLLILPNMHVSGQVTEHDYKGLLRDLTVTRACPKVLLVSAALRLEWAAVLAF